MARLVVGANVVNKSSFGYKEDCGYPKYKDPRFLIGACFSVMLLLSFTAWTLFRSPEQAEAMEKKICERSGGRWVLDHWRTTSDGPSERVYGCLKDDATEIQQAKR